MDSIERMVYELEIQRLRNENTELKWQKFKADFRAQHGYDFSFYW